jgi:ABC-type lipoprotein release transport system permease subunit
MVFSNTLLAVMISFQFGMYDLMIENTLSVLTGHIQVQAPGYNSDKKMRQSIANAPALAGQIREKLGIDTVSVRGKAFALASSEQRSFGLLVMGVQPEFEGNVSTLPGLVTEGRYLVGLNSNDAVIGSVLARNLRVETGDEITLVGTGRDGSFSAAIVTVVGIIQSGLPDLDRSIAQIPLGTFQETFSMDGHGHEIVIKTADLSGTAETKLQIRSILPSDTDLVVHDWDVLQPGLKQSIKADLFSAWFMYGVLIALVAFSVLNTVFMSVLERTREFGIIMSLGLTPGRIGRLVVLETAVMGVLGLMAGIALGAILISWAGSYGVSIPGMEEMAKRFNMPARIYPQMNLSKLSLGPLIVFAATLIASIWPAARLHWLHPVQAMRTA